MKFKNLLIVLGFMMTSKAFAVGGSLTCQSNVFPTGIGSTLELSLSADGNPKEAALYLSDSNPKLGNLKTYGNFRALAPTYNEDGTPVIYFRWYAGAGLGENGSEHLKLIPKSMVIYAFFDNYGHDKTLFLGVIEWKVDQKVESHFIFNCH